MFGEQRALDLTHAALRHTTADAEAVLVAQESWLTRFASSVVHQNLSDRTATLYLRVVHGKRAGVATTTRLDTDGLCAVVAEAEAVANLQPEVPDFPGLPEPQPLPVTKRAAFCDATAAFPATERAAGAAAVFAAAAAVGATAAGSYATDTMEMAVAGTRGVAAYGAATEAHLRAVLTSPQGSGYADRSASDVREIDAEAVGEEAARRCRLNRDQRPLEPGEYVTIFEPYAVSDLVRFLGMLGFGAKAYQEGRSFLSGRLGEAVTGPLVTITDDAAHPQTIGLMFDCEGTPKARVPLLERGVGLGVVYDWLFAAREGARSTGHAQLPGRWHIGPLPDNMVMEGGDSTVDAMIRATDRGLLVTRFHYTHAIDPKQVIATGMTRDGTFWVERGQVAGAVKNLRFAHSVLDTFAAVDMLSVERKLQRDWWSTFTPVVPALRTLRFRITGTTA